MSYTLKLTNGKILLTLADQQSDKVSTSVTLIGKNVNAYGTDLNDNFIKLLENFANSTGPTSPLIGQLWFNTLEQRVYVYNSSNEFKPVGSPVVSPTLPNGLGAGDLWIDTTTKQLKFNDGTALIVAGPMYDASKGKSGYIIEELYDVSGSPHVVATLYSNNIVMGVLSNVAFTLRSDSVTQTGLASVGVGFTSKSPAKFIGTATNADAVGGINAANILTSVGNQTMRGSLAIFNDDGLAIGTDEDIQFYVNTASNRTATMALAAVQDFNFLVKTELNPNVDLFYYSTATNGKLGIFNNNPSAAVDINGNVRISGDLQVVGGATYVTTNDLRVNDKQIELGYTDNNSITDTLADGGGITLHGSTDKEIRWYNNGGMWTSSENFNLAQYKNYRINGVDVLTANSLGVAITDAPGLRNLGSLTDLRVGSVEITTATISVTNSIPLIIGAGLTTYVDLAGKKIFNLATPVVTDNGSVAANKAYVDAAVSIARSGQYALNIDVTGHATNPEDPNLDTFVIEYLTHMLPPTDASPYGIAEGARARVLATRSSTGQTVAVSDALQLISVPVFQAGTTSTVNVVQYEGNYVASVVVPQRNLTINRAVKQYIVSGGVWTRFPYIGGSNTVHSDGTW
jgi:hypothetical protein